MVEVLDPVGCAVVMKDITHSCVAVRGVKSEDATTTTSVLRGVFENQPEARAELFSLINSI
jgi:GTP cyclohydrolase I